MGMVNRKLRVIVSTWRAEEVRRGRERENDRQENDNGVSEDQSAAHENPYPKAR